MTEQARELYQLTGSQNVSELENQLNMILNRLSDRLDGMEGLKGNPTFYKNIFDFLGSEGVTAGQVLKAISGTRAEVSSISASEVNNAVSDINSGIAANIDIAQSLISMLDVDDEVIHQFPAQQANINSSVQGFYTEEGLEELTSDDPDCGFHSAVALKISSGAVTVPMSTPFQWFTVDTETGATDDLTTINGGSAGQIILIQSADDARDVTCKTGVSLLLQTDYTLSTTKMMLLLVCKSSGVWNEICRSHGVQFPVGYIYESVDSANPATIFGYGTWALFGAGKVTVCLDSTDADFDAAEETGGAKTQDLHHDHTIDHTHAAGTTVDQNLDGTTIAIGDAPYVGPPNSGETGSTAMSIVQPYIVVYRWKRTA